MGTRYQISFSFKKISGGMKGFLVLCLSISLISSFPRAQEEDESQANVSLEEDSEGDMMAADRVMAIDEGKEAFQDMMSAVNNADERVNGISGDIEKTLSKAESAPVKY